MAMPKIFLLTLLSVLCFNVWAEECGPMEFACSGGCIPATMVCNSQPDCLQGEDEQNCPTDCSGSNQFKCSNGKCLPRTSRCDRYNDCGDFSDEADCHSVECPEIDARCKTSGACLLKSDICDGISDCEDKSDEKNCVTTCDHGFMCADKEKCYPKSYKCDGEPDCHDKSDEMGCHCDEKKFKCPNGVCIYNSFRCDGHNDCGDMSDEDDCEEINQGYCVDMLTFEDCVRMNSTAHPICTIHADANKLCKKYCGFCWF